jgi:3-hydroxyisobutyrate dehydrogenase-like beta-hydroxyacid dehydrogenase
VAFLGLGAMGRPMAARLLAVGHDVHVWNRTPGRDEELVATGAVRAGSPAQAATEAEVAITMLADPTALEEVLFGPDGVAESIRPDATVVDMSTVGPLPIRSAAERLAPTAVVDAPVLGSVPAAETGRLTILVGGGREAADRVEHLLTAMGTPMYVGPSGSGALLKLITNAASISALVGLSELLALTDRAGMDVSAVLDGLAAGPLASFVARWRDRLEGNYERPDFRLALARKDLGLVAAEAERAGRELSVAAVAAERCDEALEAGLGDRDFGAIVEFLRR